MKRSFDLRLKKKRSYNIFISGYTQFYSWVFNIILRAKQSMATSAPKFIQRLIGSSLIRTKQSVTMNTPRLISKREADLKLKTIQQLTSSTFYTNEKWSTETNIKPVAVIEVTPTKISGSSLSINTIKPIQVCSFQLIKLYYTYEWFYKTPGDTSSAYTLGDIANKTLEQMFYKSTN
ncbi:MAG: hypothetical protein ACI3YE_03350 [Candidatus Avispirillum sp.]